MQVSHPPREVVRYREGEFLAPDFFVFCVSAFMRVTTAHMKSFVKTYSLLPLLSESVNQVGGFLVYRAAEKGRYLYVLIPKDCKGEVAIYDVL